MINLVIVIAETFTLPEQLVNVLDIIEDISIGIFTVEYMLRIWTADLLYPQYSPAKARLRYIFSFMALIDLLAILPAYLPMIIPIDLRVLRILRTIRIFRIFKINRYTNALKTIGQVFKN